MRIRLIIAAVLLLVLGGYIGYYYIFIYEPPATLTVIPPEATDTQDQTRIAFIGDQGYGEPARAVLQLIKDEKTDLVVHSGDFDYTNNPDNWDQQITDILGANFPYIASVGNHDVKFWAEYQQKITDRLSRTPDVQCDGDVGVNSGCVFHNVFIDLSGIGTDDFATVSDIADRLATATQPWKVCSWHKTRELMQVGGHTDNDVPWEAYDTCREFNAMIVNGHEHSYERTYLMSGFATQQVYNTDTTLALANGHSFSVVSGLAGKSIRGTDDNRDQNPWWAAVYTADQNATYGVLLCDFGATEPYTTDCYFKNIDGAIIDTFILTTE